MKHLIILLLLTSFWLPGYSQSYPPVPAINNPPLFNEQLRYTASLLRQPRTSVRVLVYGQSISVQDWWKEVKLYLEKKYPDHQIKVENKAIGGFSTERLKLMVANDIISSYPDLILFHDYGNEADYEGIIRVIQSITTADIAVQTDHMAQQNQEWHDRHSNVWLPELCKKYGLALMDVRKYWKLYLQENKLEIKNLLTDGVHLNEQGNYLMAGIIKNYLDNLTISKNRDDRKKVLKQGVDFSAIRDTINLSFQGNRIDIRADPDGNGKSISLLLDKQALNTTAACYYYTRPSIDTSRSFLTNIGLLLAMELLPNIDEEDWQLTILSVDSITQQLSYSIRGTRTGDDGTGSSSGVFKSGSGKIIIRPEYWFRRKSKSDFAQFHWLQPGDVLHWKIKPLCRDTLVLSGKSSQTLFQGVSNTAHQLKLSGPGTKHIREIIVYAPMLRDK